MTKKDISTIIHALRILQIEGYYGNVIDLDYIRIKLLIEKLDRIRSNKNDNIKR